MQFGRVLDRHHPLATIRHRQDRARQRGLARRRAAGNEHVQALLDGQPQQVRKIARIGQRPEPALPVPPPVFHVDLRAHEEAHLVGVEDPRDVFADRDRHALLDRGGNDDLHAHRLAEHDHPAGDDRMPGAELVLRLSGKVRAQHLQTVGRNRPVPGPHVRVLGILDPDALVGIDDDFVHVLRDEKVAQRQEALFGVAGGVCHLAQNTRSLFTKTVMSVPWSM